MRVSNCKALIEKILVFLDKWSLIGLGMVTCKGLSRRGGGGGTL